MGYSEPTRYLKYIKYLKHLRFLKRIIEKLYTNAFERLYNINTVSIPGKKITVSALFGDSNLYEAVDYWLIHNIIKPLEPKPADVVFDIGCGMGRVLCVFARMDVKKCIGIEVSPELAEIAVKNSQKLYSRGAEITIINKDAVYADYSDGTIYWLFNPFGADTLHMVLDRIHETLVAHPRKIYLVYAYPVHEKVLESKSWLKCVGGKSFWYSKTTVSYWTNDG